MRKASAVPPSHLEKAMGPIMPTMRGARSVRGLASLMPTLAALRMSLPFIVLPPVGVKLF